MCTCKQKSKKPAGSPGNFNYVFSCITSDGKKKEIKLNAGNDLDAKSLAELECEESEVTNAIKAIIAEDFGLDLHVLLHSSFSTDQTVVVSYWGTSAWFEIPSKAIKKIRQVGYGICDGVQYPLVQLLIKAELENYRSELLKLKFAIMNESDGLDLPIPSDLFDARKGTRLTELSGGQWVARYPGRNSVSDLRQPFQAQFQRFYSALINASANVQMQAVFRPVQRAYLMRTAYDIANQIIRPENAGALPGVDIQWVHGTLQASIAAARAMVSGYGIVYRPAYPTKHSDGTAVDMTVSWNGTLNIAQQNGTIVPITTAPRTHMNPDLHQVAATYGVQKLVSDPPHWSDNGH